MFITLTNYNFKYIDQLLYLYIWKVICILKLISLFTRIEYLVLSKVDISVYVIYSTVTVSFMPVDIVCANVTYYGHTIFLVAIFTK